jgi:hypothetical protein
MARKTRSRRRKTTKRRNPRISKAKRRAAALKGWRKKKRKNPGRRRRRKTTKSRRRRNARGWFKTRASKTYKRRGKVRGRGRKKRSTRPVKRSTLRRRARARRRNPNGYVGKLTKMSTWVDAMQVAGGGIGAGMLAGWAYNNFAPAALQAPNVKMIARPASIALAGALLGWVTGNLLKQKALGNKIATGGVIAAAFDIGNQIVGRMGLMGMGDYVQLQGLGTQAQVEAGVFGLGNQAQVEAGNFDGMGDYVQMSGLGHSVDEVAAANTFGPTF